MSDLKKPIECFFPRIANVCAVKAALREAYGNRTAAILAKLKEGQPLADDERDGISIEAIEDLVMNKSKFIKTIYRPDQSDKGDFYNRMWVKIWRFGSGRGHYVYWFHEPEGEGTTGYFGSMADARAYAEAYSLT